MYKKLILGLILLSLCTGLIFSQQPPTQPWWFTLERGIRHFRDASYGHALNAFEDARRERYLHFSLMEEDFIRFLSIPEVRWLGDTLDFVEWYIDEFNETRAAAILDELYHYFPQASFNNSVNEVLMQLDNLKRYPEAEFWLGETFKVEGELLLAQRQYERALSDRDLFIRPDLDLHILYQIVDIHRIRGEYREMEDRYYQIINTDSLWTAGNPNEPQTMMRAAMLRMLETSTSINVREIGGGINQFLSFYRHNSMNTERAHRELGIYLYSRGRYTTAVSHLMFAFLIQNTVLIEDAIRREFDFIFTSLDDLMQIIGNRRELLDFLEEIEYFRLIYYFSSALYATNRQIPALQLWEFLARSDRAGAWGERARMSSVPIVENVIVIP